MNSAQCQSLLMERIKEPVKSRGNTLYKPSLQPQQLCNRIQIDNFMEQYEVVRQTNMHQRQAKQNLFDQLTVSQLNDYKVSPINRETNFNDREGNPCSSIEQQQDSDISVQGLSPFILNKDNNNNIHMKQEKESLKGFDMKATFASKSNNNQRNLKQADEKSNLNNNMRIIIQKKQKQKLLNGFKKSIESQKDYIESRMKKYVEEQQHVKKEEEKPYGAILQQLNALKVETSTPKYHEDTKQQEYQMRQELNEESGIVHPFLLDNTSLLRLQLNRVTQFKIDDDSDLDLCQITSPTTATSQNSKIFLFSNPQASPKQEAKFPTKQTQKIHSKQIFCVQTEQTQESSGDFSDEKEKEKERDEDDDMNNTKICSQNTLILTQTAKQRNEINSLMQSPCMTRVKFDNTLTQKKDSTSLYYSHLNTCNNTNSTNRSILKVSPPCTSSFKNEANISQNRNFLFKINKNPGNLLKKESNFASQIKLIPDVKEQQRPYMNLKACIPIPGGKGKKETNPMITSSMLNLKFKEQQRKVTSFLQKTLNKNN